jgi:hypothetical protein
MGWGGPATLTFMLCIYAWRSAGLMPAIAAWRAKLAGDRGAGARTTLLLGTGAYPIFI